MQTPTERFARAHDRWLDPPEDYERCEYCGLRMDEWPPGTGEFVCRNPDCTTVLDDIETDFLTDEEEENDDADEED